MKLKHSVEPARDLFSKGKQGAAGAKGDLCKYECVCNWQGRLCSTDKSGLQCKISRKLSGPSPIYSHRMQHGYRNCVEKPLPFLLGMMIGIGLTYSLLPLDCSAFSKVGL